MDTQNRKPQMSKAGKLAGRSAYSAVIAGLALTLMFGGNAAAQQQDTQQRDQNQTQQNQQQTLQSDPQQDPAQQSQSPDQTQAPNSPNQPATPSAPAKPTPKYAPQDANRPPYANDRQQQSPYSAPPPDAQNGDDQDQDGPPDTQQAPPPPPSNRNYRTRPPQYDNGYDQGPQARLAQPTGPVPNTLTIPAGTVFTVRMNDFVSSDKNQVGDHITATLDRPIVVNGWVVARRGQTLTGQVTAAVKAGRIKGTSQLGLELTDLTLVDGKDAPILTEIWKGSGGTTHGADAAAIGGTTALGAAIGSVADWGRGAAIGAGAGAAAGIGAVLLTRGRPTELLPETPLAFRLVDPVTVDTTQSAQSFAPVTQQDYDNGRRGHRDGRRYPPYGPYAYGAPYPGPYAYPYPYPYYGYGPGVVIYGGRWRRW
jgi:hypothetical protein